MNTYIIFGKANSEYASGMINKPQDRLSIVKKVTDQFDMNFFLQILKVLLFSVC